MTALRACRLLVTAICFGTLVSTAWERRGACLGRFQ